MTNHDPSLRDELVAAYIDGEATEEERTAVEADPELLARAEEMRAVAALVGAPVTQPAAAVKENQIAAALAASSTAPNVASLATRRRHRRFARIASVAAVLLLILAVPLVLLNLDSGDGDETAAVTAQEEAGSAASSAESEAEADQGASAAAGSDSLSGESSAEAPVAEAAPAEELDSGADMSGDNVDTPSADEAGDDGSMMAEEGAAEVEEASVEEAARLDLDDVADFDSLSQQVLRELDAGVDDSAPQQSSELDCVAEFASQPGSDGTLPELLLIGSATVDGQLVEYATISTTDGLELVAFDSQCAQLASVPLD